MRLTLNIAVGLVALAGVAAVETVLASGMAVGAAAAAAPRYLLKSRRRRPSPFKSARPRLEPLAREAQIHSLALVPRRLFAGPAVKRAIFKTITFRIIVTTLDFTTNYVVIGELGAAAGLSAFTLVTGPLFYLAHEMAWNVYGPQEAAVDITRLFSRRQDSDPRKADFTMSRTLVKTVTFRTVATTVDFTATYIIVGDLLTAAGLSAVGFVAGPFVYYGHEWLWDRFGASVEPPAGALKPINPPSRRLIGHESHYDALRVSEE
jgi:uncharacterized membrane protein